ncbi:MAG: hypothetical protein ACLQT6_12780 [Desulfomonilaceae bacterium]
MNRTLIQTFRERLHRRFSALEGCDPFVFHWRLCQFWEFIQGTDIIRSILSELESIAPDQLERVTNLADGKLPYGQFESFRSECEQRSFAFQLLKRVVAVEPRSSDTQNEIAIGRRYTGTGGSQSSKSAFCKEFVEPVFRFIDERLDNQNILLHLLKRYKHVCEWFRQEELLESFLKQKDDRTRKGEYYLALNLYEFLYLSGLEFHIEPRSDSGRIDLISEQIGPNRLLVEVKIFDGNKSYISKGLSQLFDYTTSYNEPFGVLVIFDTSDTGLCCATDLSENPFNVIRFHDKTLYILVIDLVKRGAASKRGKLKQIVMEREDFVIELNEGEQ